MSKPKKTEQQKRDDMYRQRAQDFDIQRKREGKAKARPPRVTGLV